MFRFSLLLIGNVLLAFALVSCSKEPAAQYRLSAEQLAWQGYYAGEGLRFSHVQDAKVRTYRVTNIDDRMETQHTGIFIGNRPEYQQITVTVQRTDSVFRPVPALVLGRNLVYTDEPDLRARAEWETFYYAPLPLDNVIKGTPIDTLYGYRPGTRLLASATLGPATYSQVIRVDNRPAPGTAPLGRSTRRLYYARGKGVVAFEEAGNDLWYRLP